MFRDHLPIGSLHCKKRLYRQCKICKFSSASFVACPRYLVICASYFILYPRSRRCVSFHTLCACPVPAPLFTIICILLIFPQCHAMYFRAEPQYLYYTIFTACIQEISSRIIPLNISLLFTPFLATHFAIQKSHQPICSDHQVKIIHKSVKISEAFFPKSIYYINRMCYSAVAPAQTQQYCLVQNKNTET